MQMVIINLKKTALVFLLLFFVNGCTFAKEKAENCTGHKIDHFLGKYQVTSVVRYRGGLTTEVQANSKLKSILIIDLNLFDMAGFAAYESKIDFRCVSNVSEGEVPVEKFSSFYGLRSDREVIELMKIAPQIEGATGIPIQFEIVGEELWYLFDGWVYKYSKSNA
ncbi:hypothetical protein [Paraglaciecola sp.]|uniref:hypothetical protein n=1 Tax=Paraglaciecola sp. TaxID=1920173 RepID=UPI003265EC7C